ncbi:MAG: DUF434 domain-containing protein [Methanobacteriota archaeon]
MKDAICDLRFLLNRGYNKSSAVNFVANKYKLGIKSRNFLVRAVFSLSEAEEHRKKRIDIKKIKGRGIVIDGYNVLITVESALKGKEVILCDDGFVRDTSATFGKYKLSKVTLPAIEKIMKILKSNAVGRALFIFDSQVSFSGELCRLIREKLAEHALNGDAITSESADYIIIKSKGIVCTSDRAIIKKAAKVVDIPYYIAKRSKKGP